MRSALDADTRRKLEDMEASVKDITQRRLDFLEEAQKQQINFQVRVPQSFQVLVSQSFKVRVPQSFQVRVSDGHLHVHVLESIRNMLKYKAAF